MSIEMTIEQFVREELLFGDERVHIDPNQDLLASGILDSMGVLRLILFIEQQFALPIGDDEVVPENFRSINHIKAFIVSKQQPQVTAA